jgi:glycosyltransferase involved in cell wall biosynthesis
VKLVLRSRLPPDLHGHHLEIIRTCDVEVIDRFLSHEELHALLTRTDIYVLPSARIHAVSILQAMAYGLALVASDGWGIEDYVEDGRNGLIVRGRYGKCSWMDGDGMLREDYRPLWSVDPLVVRGLADALSTLIEDHELRERLAETARRHVETRFTIDNWNRGLAQALRSEVHGAVETVGHANR